MSERVVSKLSVMSNCLQEPYKTDSMETSGEKASTRTESFNGRESDGNCTACASKRSRESSVFQLIVTPKDEKLVKCCSLHGFKRVLCFLMIVFLIAVLCTMTGLYISQKHKLTRITSVDAGRMDALKTKTTAATPKMKKTLLNCVPVLNAKPLPSMPPEIAHMIEGLNKEVEGLYKMYKLKAASVGFSYRGELWWSKHVGSMNFSDINAPLPNNDTPYPVASITKLITAIMMHKLFEEGKIDSLDDPVKKYIPEFSVKNPFNKEKITLRQLSCMMSGLPREAPCYPPEKRDYCPFSSSEMMEKIANISLILPPDKNPSYSNIGYSILGSALEKIAGVPYEEWVTKNILKPLGMNNSGFDSVASAKKFPISTNLDGSIVDIVDWGWLKTSGGLYSSMNDLNQVAKMLFEMLNDTTVLHRNTARKLFKPAFLFNSGHGTGYSFEILSSRAFAATKHHSGSNLEHMIYAKSGAFFGYGALIALVPEFKLAAFSLVAHAGVEKAPGMLAMSPLKVMEPLEQVLLRSLPKYILPPSPSIYIGKYKLVQYWPLVTDLIEVFMKGDTLYMKIQWLTVPLSYVSPLVLVTGHFGKNPMYSCEDFFLSSGLSHVKCNFRKPLQPGGKSPSFLVKGITTYGMAEFKRVSK